jgi:Protein of unknown function (DUF732)
MRMLFAVLGVSAAIGLAVPAYGDPDGGGDDAGFLSALRQVDIGFDNPDQAVGAGKAVCRCLDNGESGLELVHDVKIHNPGFDMEGASNFAMISAKFYCPHQLSRA